MIQDRRNFLTQALAASVGTSLSSCLPSTKAEETAAQRNTLHKIETQSILKKDLFDKPLIIESLDLLKRENNFLCRVATNDGVVGYSISNNAQMASLYPIFINRLQPYFIGKDARDLEQLLDEVYVYKSNYKLQSLALWVPLATIEFAILDLLGRVSGKPMGELIGERHQQHIKVYRANNYRGKSAEESIEKIIQNVEESGSNALKFKIGGRMSNDRDYPPGRTEALIPLIRKSFGEEMTIYADSNGSYTTGKAIEIGKLLEDFKIDFYEEPVPFDWYEETKEVASALSIPIAGGEQEPSLHQFGWLIDNHALDIVQPDIFYFGGMIRSMKVALMADAMGKICIPHISGSGLGYLYMMQFVSVLPNAGPYHEFKGFSSDIPFNCDSSDLRITNGSIQVPSGPGSGIELDPDFIAQHRKVEI